MNPLKKNSDRREDIVDEYKNKIYVTEGQVYADRNEKAKIAAISLTVVIFGGYISALIASEIGERLCVENEIAGELDENDVNSVIKAGIRLVSSEVASECNADITVSAISYKNRVLEALGCMEETASETTIWPTCLELKDRFDNHIKILKTPSTTNQLADDFS